MCVCDPTYNSNSRAQDPPKFSLMSIFANPMLLMVLVMGGLSFCLPKLMENVDPEALREAQGIKKRDDGDEEEAPRAAAAIESPNVFGITRKAPVKSSSSSSPSSSSSSTSSSSSSSSSTRGKVTPAPKAAPVSRGSKTSTAVEEMD